MQSFSRALLLQMRSCERPPYPRILTLVSLAKSLADLEINNIAAAQPLAFCYNSAHAQRVFVRVQSPRSPLSQPKEFGPGELGSSPAARRAEAAMPSAKPQHPR